jgi:hypothetical protein
MDDETAPSLPVEAPEAPEAPQNGGCGGNGPSTEREGKPFPWRALYKALVKRLIELDEQFPVSSSRLQPEIAALAQVHGEILDRQDTDD